MTFREKCQEIAGTELWKLVEEKADGDSELLAAVGELCYGGVVLSKDVIRFFPTFTLHDGTHIAGVCKWMIRLLGDRKDDLSLNEAIMLVLAACWHDSGMCVSEEQKARLENELRAEPYPEDWTEFFRKYPGDEVEYRETKTVSEAMLRKFVRLNHHSRADEQLPQDWPRALTERGLHRSLLVKLCKSHGEKLPDTTLTGGPADCDLNLCLILLRLADTLDYDAARAPQALFEHLGLDHPDTPERKKSRDEWEKNASGCFGEIKDGVIPYRAQFHDPQLEHEASEYLKWLEEELLRCRDMLRRYAGRWQTLELPNRVVRSIERVGYEGGDFNLTMDQDRVLELLTGKSLYDNPGVFVRELLQNAIDAVLIRRRLDSRFGENGGKIVVRTWIDGEGNGWFRIEDDGIGMDEHIIKDYFLKVGRSYYTSKEFDRTLLHEAKNTGSRPTSRFGIGVLSCFMSDPDNLVEVVTRRFSEDGERHPVLQLNVTGLHGYYSLTKRERKNQGSRHIHRPPEELDAEDGYRRDVGTTVCVRFNPYSLGGLRTIRELMDKYVWFPEVRVEYHGQEGTFTYPTQAELEEAAHRLNPDGADAELKEYRHPLPDRVIEEMKACYPKADWAGGAAPELVLRYVPLDWLSVTGNVSGVVVQTEVRLPVIVEEVQNKGKTYHMKLWAEFDWYTEAIDLKPILVEEAPVSVEEYAATSSNFVPLSFDEILSAASREEAALLNMCTRAQKAEVVAAYNGVLAGVLLYHQLYHQIANSLATILLRGENRPEVDLSRDSIRSVPLATACELAVIDEAVPLNLFFLNSDANHLASTEDFWRILDRYPAMEARLRIGGKSIAELRETDETDGEADVEVLGWPVYDRLCLAALRRRFAVSVNDRSESKRNKAYLSLTASAEGGDTAAFPPVFLPFDSRLEKRFKIAQFCNRNHRFSRWLMARREELQKKAPRIYGGIWNAMFVSRYNDDILQELNDTLERLRAFDGNPFGVTDDLFLTKHDFFDLL